MSNVLIIEDSPEHSLLYRCNIRGQGEEQLHEIIGEARTLSEAFSWITKMSLKEVNVDVILLDGNLDCSEPRPVFTHTSLGEDGSEARIVIDANDPKYRDICGDALAIVDALKAIGSTAITIGVSNASMSYYGVKVNDCIPKDSAIELRTKLDNIHSNAQ